MGSYVLLDVQFVLLIFDFMRFLLVLTLFVCSLIVNGQDYLVTTRNDTLKGEIRLLNFGKVDQAQISINKKKKVLTAIEVKLVYMKGEAYKPLSFDNAIHFMKVLKTGYVSYYAFQPANQTSYDGRYIARIDGRGIEVPNLGFKRVMSNFMEDCPDVTAKIKSEELKRTDLEKILDEYNKCIDSKTIASHKTIEQVNSGNQKLEAVKKLQTKVEGLDNLSNKKDVTDLLSDLSDKISRNQSIANYQLEALKGLLKDNEQTKEELNAVVALLSSN